jgi:hypothetical protein
MDFTSTTEIARKGSKTFQEFNYATVLHNNKDIGMVVWWALYQKIKNSHYFDDVLEDMEMDMNREKLQKEFIESSNSGPSDLVI